MECKIWNEQGLLFTSGELDAKEKVAFEMHSASCTLCASELAEYAAVRSICTKDLLEVTPSEKCDKEIVRICSKPKRYTSIFSSMPVLVRQSLSAIAILIAGFAGGSYFVGLQMAAKSDVQKSTVQIAVSKPSYEAVASKTDSVFKKKDSAYQKPTLIKGRGDMSQQGVVPVDLTDEE